MSRSSTNNKLEEESELEKEPLKQIYLDFSNIESQIFCFDIQVEFEFSNDTLLSLSKTLSNFSK